MRRVISGERTSFVCYDYLVAAIIFCSSNPGMQRKPEVQLQEWLQKPRRLKEMPRSC